MTWPDQHPEEETYTVGTLMGSGGYSTVYTGWSISGEAVAVKVIPKANIRRWTTFHGQRLPMEVLLMEKVRHVQGVASLIHFQEDEENFKIIMEKPDPSQDLYYYLYERVSLNEKEACYLFKQVVNIIGQIHASGVVHRDLKTENILVNLETQMVYIIDFGGGAIYSDTPFTDFEGTMEYSPPEWINEQCYNGILAEIWALGILLFTMMHRDVPFLTDEQILTAQPNFRWNLSAQARDLIMKCLSINPKDRPSIRDIQEHPWMNNRALSEDHRFIHKE